jgi:hypothetical protein
VSRPPESSNLESPVGRLDGSYVLWVGLAEAEEAYVDSVGVLSPLHRDTEVLDVVRWLGTSS